MYDKISESFNADFEDNSVEEVIMPRLLFIFGVNLNV